MPNELMKFYRLDCAGIMFQVDLIQGALRFSTTNYRCKGRNKSNHNIKRFGNRKNETVQQRLPGSVATFHQQSDHTNNYSALECNTHHWFFTLSHED